MLPINNALVKRKFRPPTRISVGETTAKNQQQHHTSTSTVLPKNQEYEVLYAKKGPKKKVSWHDGVLQQEVMKVGGDKWVLLDRDSKCVLSRAFGVLTGESGTINENFFGRYKLQFDQSIGQGEEKKRQPLAEVTKQSIMMKAKRVKLPQQKSTAFSAPSRIAINTSSREIFIIQEKPRVSMSGSILKKLRPHQCEGIKFLYHALAGNSAGHGAILADDMGLGKTLTTLCILRLLAKAAICVNEDINCKARKVAILCPATLVMQWVKENTKWFGSISSNIQFIAAIETPGAKYDGNSMSPQEAISSWNTLDGRNGCKVLVVSYETSLRNAQAIFHENQLDGLIMDEGHRLKNATSKMTQLIRSCRAKTRLLITGTPAMNNLEEFFVLADCVNPGIFGDIKAFKNNYVKAIDRGSKKDASTTAIRAAQEAQDTIRTIAKPFYLRRVASEIKRDKMPPKIIHFVCCLMTSSQRTAYLKACRTANKERSCDVDVLSQLQLLRALATRGNYQASDADIDITNVSGKIVALISLLSTIIHTTKDKVVLVSTSTQTLDLFAKICDAKSWPFLRLDGSTAADERNNLVTRFNSITNPNRIFLLSSRAGGCGINLIGANRLVLVDADWNPALDEQAMARVWRDGQTKHVHIYRFLTRSSIDEVMVQRQFAKHDLADGVVDGAKINGRFNTDQLKDLFTLNESLPSTAAHALDWPVYRGPDTISDQVLKQAALNTPGVVTYVRSIDSSKDTLLSSHPAKPVTTTTSSTTKSPILTLCKRKSDHDDLLDLTSLDEPSLSISDDDDDFLPSLPADKKRKRSPKKRIVIEDDDEEEEGPVFGNSSPAVVKKQESSTMMIVDDDYDDFDEEGQWCSFFRTYINTC